MTRKGGAVMFNSTAVMILAPENHSFVLNENECTRRHSSGDRVGSFWLARKTKGYSN